MAETEKGKPVFRTATPRDKKIVKSHTFDPRVAEWLEAEAEQRGVSQSALLRQILNEERAGKKVVPKILRGDCRIVHMTSINRAENRLYLTSSGVYPEAGPPFGVPHEAEGRMEEFIEKGLHAFDPKCEGCKFLAASRALPGVFREG